MKKTIVLVLIAAFILSSCARRGAGGGSGPQDGSGPNPFCYKK